MSYSFGNENIDDKYKIYDEGVEIASTSSASKSNALYDDNEGNVESEKIIKDATSSNLSDLNNPSSSDSDVKFKSIIKKDGEYFVKAKLDASKLPKKSKLEISETDGSDFEFLKDKTEDSENMEFSDSDIKSLSISVVDGESGEVVDYSGEMDLYIKRYIPEEWKSENIEDNTQKEIKFMRFHNENEAYGEIDIIKEAPYSKDMYGNRSYALKSSEDSLSVTGKYIEAKAYMENAEMRNTFMFVKRDLSASVATSPFEKLKMDIENAAEGIETVVTVSGDIEFTKTIKISSGKKIVIKNNDNCILKPAEGFLGDLIEIEEGASLDISTDDKFIMDACDKELHIIKSEGELIINNGKYTGVKDESAILIEGQKASFVLNEGEIYGNRIEHGYSVQYKAPVKVRNEAKFIMNGGSIHDNIPNLYSASAIYILEGASFTMNGGSISENGRNVAENAYAAVTIGDGSPYTYKTHKKTLDENDIEPVTKASFNGGIINDNIGCFGGGIAVFGKTDVQIPKDSKILVSNNIGFAGGGILVYDFYIDGGGELYGHAQRNVAAAPFDEWNKCYGPSFVMEGGEISDNKTYTCGGGIDVSANGVSLLGGLISNNYAKDQGGGVYVTTTPYVLHVKNAYIARNIADGDMSTSISREFYDGTDEDVILPSKSGGGVWFCPTGDATFYTEKGVIFDENKAIDVNDPTRLSGGDDFWSYKRKSHALGPNEDKIKYSVTLPERLPNGARVKYYRDESGNRYSDIRKDEIEDINGYNESLALKAIAERESIDISKTLSDLIITGNHASKGGGIGSNGSIIFGEKSKLINILVEKKWEMIPDDKKHSVELEIRAKAGGFDWLIDTVVLSEENEWKAVIKNLPEYIYGEKLEDIIYINEKDSGDYLLTREYDKVNFKYDIINKPITDITVRKNWDDFNDIYGLRPDMVEFQLLKDGNKVDGSIIKLSEENNWEYTFEKLDKYSKTINSEGEEVIVEAKYSVYELSKSQFYVSVADNYVITNKLKTVDIPVEKIWSGGNDTDYIAVEIELLMSRDSENFKLTGKKAILNKENEWKYTFENLPKFNENGEIKYKIIELTKIENYESTVTGDGNTGFTVVNSFIKPEKPLEPDKPSTPSEPDKPFKPSRPSNPGGGGGHHFEHINYPPVEEKDNFQQKQIEVKNSISDEESITPKRKTYVKTADRSRIYLYIAYILTSIVALSWMAFRKKKENK